MKLFNYYTLDECKDRKKVFEKLDELKNEGKIEYAQGSTLLRKQVSIYLVFPPNCYKNYT